LGGVADEPFYAHQLAQPVVEACRRSGGRAAGARPNYIGPCRYGNRSYAPADLWGHLLVGPSIWPEPERPAAVNQRDRDCRTDVRRLWPEPLPQPHRNGPMGQEAGVYW